MIDQQFRTTPLRLSFVITSLPVGGAETLLMNLVRRMDRTRVCPQVLCLKEAGELGERIAAEVPLTCRLLSHKFDVRILPRLIRMFRRQQTDAVITIGAGDKMFWGRLAAKLARVPVICSALHSTGWPDGVGRLNRMLTGITDGFIACAQNHANYLVNEEGFPRTKVFTIPNGVDVNRFRPNPSKRQWLRDELQIAGDANLVGIVAALREEKNHTQLIDAAHEILRNYPNTHFVLVGDGPMRSSIEDQIATHGLHGHFHLLGTRSDTYDILAALDIFVLTSKNEANPVSTLEALATGIPAVCPNVGSVSESVIHNRTGLLTKPLDSQSTADAIGRLLGAPVWARQLGDNGRNEVCDNWSLETMVHGYETLATMLYNTKASKPISPKSTHASTLPNHSIS
jgi:glycosyltransferase involved in cell wall biosynthesis